MLAANVESAAKSGANGSDMCRAIVLSSTLVTDFTGEKRNPHSLFWSIARVSDNTTSSAVSGVPSENFTPCRSVNVAVSPSGAIFQDVASSGCTSLLVGASFTRRSYTIIWVKIEGSSPVGYGSQVSMSAFRAIESVTTGAPADGRGSNMVIGTNSATATSKLTARSAVKRIRVLGRLPTIESPLPLVGPGPGPRPCGCSH